MTVVDRPDAGQDPDWTWDRPLPIAAAAPVGRGRRGPSTLLRWSAAVITLMLVVLVLVG